MNRPAFLKKGDTLGLVAPSFGATIEPYSTRLAAAIPRFEARGYKVRCADSVYKSDGLGISTDPRIESSLTIGATGDIPIMFLPAYSKFENKAEE